MILYHGTNQAFGDIDLAPTSVCNATPPASTTRVPAMSTASSIVS